MRVHIIAIGGTFMAGIAAIAKEAGHKVSGVDNAIYPPMSDQLAGLGVDLVEGYEAELPENVDLFIVGNTVGRGNPAVEALLRDRRPMVSGPQWLYENVLQERHVLAVAGTHGKTTTSSMLAWILEKEKLSPGYLIGGIPKNFDVSARLGDAPYFVIEADEYDTAFFDKRSKFVHYFPKTLVINNLEFDHADIFPDLAAIQRQFHHVVRIVPDDGRVVCPPNTPAIDEVLGMGCWSETATFGLDSSAPSNDWYARVTPEGKVEVFAHDAVVATVQWPFSGDYNLENALAACAAAEHIGIKPARAVKALTSFKGVKRRLEKYAEVAGVTLYDDFAHHPTAIRKTLGGLRRQLGSANLTVIFEPRSNTMKQGVHKDVLAGSFLPADRVILYRPEGIQWSLGDVARELDDGVVYDDVNGIISDVCEHAEPGHHVIIMSNGGFGGLHQKLSEALGDKKSASAA